MAEQTSISIDPANRYALYYPYIHIRDENWLKGAILGFQQVRRIVPNEFTIRDEAITSPYARLKSPAGTLLKPVIINSPQIYESQTWLRTKITERLNELIPKYAEENVSLEYRRGSETFEMHVGKFLDPELLNILKGARLAWHSRDNREHDPWDWVTMHPKMGSAMMSTLALAVARSEGLSVLTPSGTAHHELLANREERVFEKLLEVPLPPDTATSHDVAVEELAHVVITTGFDLTRLTPEQVCELLNQGKDLRSFRSAIASFVARIPAGLGPDERVKRLKIEAESVLDEWEKYSGTLPPFAKDALVDAAFDKLPEKGLELGLTAVGGAALSTVVGALPGLLITIGVAAGVKMFRKRDTPLRFLTRVNRVVNRSIGSIYVPQWSSLTGQAS